MNKTISTLCVALVLLIGTVPYADAMGHGGSHGGGLGPGSFHSGGFSQGAFPGGGFGPHPFIPPPRCACFDGFRGGVFFYVPPVWGCPSSAGAVTRCPPAGWAH